MFDQVQSKQLIAKVNQKGKTVKKAYPERCLDLRINKGILEVKKQISKIKGPLSSSSLIILTATTVFFCQSKNNQKQIYLLIEQQISIKQCYQSLIFALLLLINHIYFIVIFNQLLPFNLNSINHEKQVKKQQFIENKNINDNSVSFVLNQYTQIKYCLLAEFQKLISNLLIYKLY
ncbi:unnamed protein product [Paramecium pentaurelia]|uniref:Transmembrane protein n=1 Tax=Paramecium pentaurelia TaxID=43138 RepID=A0A8S1U1T8_9CILI|nr:unnamed protein product [Paramecium pentaurelia]